MITIFGWYILLCIYNYTGRFLAIHHFDFDYFRQFSSDFDVLRRFGNLKGSAKRFFLWKFDYLDLFRNDGKIAKSLNLLKLADARFRASWINHAI